MVSQATCLMFLAIVTTVLVVPVKSSPKILIAGRSDEDNEGYVINAFDTKTGNWSEFPVVAQQSEDWRTYCWNNAFGATVLGMHRTSNLYIPCGINNAEGSFQALNNRKKTWFAVEIKEPVEGVLNFANLFSVGKKIYVLEDHHLYGNIFYGYPETNVWKRGPKSNLPPSKSSGTVVGNDVYQCDLYYARSDKCEKYDTTTNKWTMLPKMLHKHEGYTMASLKGLVYVLGDGGDWRNLENEKFDPAKNAWSKVPEMSTPERQHAAAIGYGEYLYVFGGQSGLNYFETAEKYDPTTNAWTALEFKTPRKMRAETKAVLFDWPYDPKAGEKPKEACDPEEPDCGN